MLSQQSVIRLRRVIGFILREPRRFNMSAGVEPADIYLRMKEQPPCGTACCIGGAAYLIKNKTGLKGFTKPLHVRWNVVRASSADFLGLDFGQSARLFYTAQWPSVYKQLYDEAKTAHELAAVGVLRIEHFIATGGDE